MLLQGNALGGEGLTNLCPGLAACVTMSEVNLRAVGVTDDHLQAVRLFADVASCHPMLQIINLDGNLIGKRLEEWIGDSGCKVVEPVGRGFSMAAR